MRRPRFRFKDSRAVRIDFRRADRSVQTDARASPAVLTVGAAESAP
jgi:hypothetical protein